MTASMISTSRETTEQRGYAVAFGVSVAGPAHVAAALPNQDAWSWTRWRQRQEDVYCAVVCDGLGSRSQAREGALAGVRAAKRAARQWARAPGAPVSLLVRLVEVLWRLEVAPHPPGNCATTCLIVLAFPEGKTTRLVILTLGDSRCIVEAAGGLHILGGRAADQFSNVTLALGTPHHMDDWQLQDFKTEGQVRVLILSDGIADDVSVEKFPELFSWLSDFENRPASARGQALRRALRSWPVLGHSDDKTLVYLHLGGG